MLVVIDSYLMDSHQDWVPAVKEYSWDIWFLLMNQYDYFIKRVSQAFKYEWFLRSSQLNWVLGLVPQDLLNFRDSQASQWDYLRDLRFSNLLSFWYLQFLIFCSNEDQVLQV